ncbi:glycosyltransferase family 2 protein [Schlesneria paludicola]|uniref:glycosyltransferase family 2 protein n=1 Tax=Schlesneria paludicola TaxID=360056 RepID=UPI00029A41D9|nr:glycosyltransferase family 2 protein [Schlesneria paludicola]
MTIGSQCLLWLSLIGLWYIYAGYPLLMWICARRFPRPQLKQSEPRTLSIVIVAHNESKNLPRKLASLFSCSQSQWIQEILIGSDGSTDDTVTTTQSYPDPRVRAVDFAMRRGKPAVLNDLVPECTGEFVLLADARQDFDHDCLERLLENFADPRVGVVSGELILRSAPGETTAAQGIGFYWKYEKFIRRSESHFRGVPGATGACYVIRKSLFRPIPEQTILDDVAIPMLAVQQGALCVFEPRALIFDKPSQSTRQESVRKRRTIAGAAQLIQLFPQWLSPLRNPLWLEFVSHKLLRLASPILLVTAFLTNLTLLAHPLYRLLFAAQVTFFASAAIGWFFQVIGRRAAICGPSLMFLTLNYTTALALWDAVRSRYRVTWQK